MDATTEFDCVIIGAGLAGAAAAAVLGRDGHRVALVDPRAECRPTFKAEKIEPDQAELLRRLGLADGVLPRAARIHHIREAHRGRVLRTVPIEQYGMRYHDIVNAVRAQVPAAVRQYVARAKGVETRPDRQRVTLDSGETLTTRLIVSAEGVGGAVQRSLGITRVPIRAKHSVSIGFDIARADATPFAFDALTYWADSLAGRLDYVTLFRVPGAMRANIFCYLDPRDAARNELVAHPRATLDRLCPGMAGLIGDWMVTARVESQAIDLYRAVTPQQHGVVLIGDALQSVCPATGTGLSKVLTDVEVLCRTAVPRWFATPEMRAEKLASFYSDPRKLSVDRQSLENAEYRRRFSTDASLRWRVHRRRSFLQMRWSRPSSEAANRG